MNDLSEHLFLIYLCFWQYSQHKTRLLIGQLVKDTSAKLKQASETDHHAEVSVHILAMEWATEFGTEIDIICRRLAPITAGTWLRMDPTDKAKLYRFLHNGSAINKANRKKIVTNHCAGSKPFVRLRQELRDPLTEDEPDRVTFYRQSPFRERTARGLHHVARQS